MERVVIIDGVRVGRHLRPDAPLRWNVNHLKRVAVPVELWWSHPPKEKPAECEWAMTLAAVPAACCPAPRCGANDCKRCPAHLIHFVNLPRAQDFLARLAARGAGGLAFFRWQLA